MPETSKTTTKRPRPAAKSSTSRKAAVKPKNPTLAELRQAMAMPLSIPPVKEEEPEPTVSVVDSLDDWYLKLTKAAFETKE